MTESQARRWYPAALTVLGLLLFFPGLGSFGLWDPYEIRIADAARAVVTVGRWTTAPQLGKPPAEILAVAAGFRYLGVGELGGRLPIALLSLLALLATYYAGAALVKRRAALLGAAALATCPGFLLGARQLTSNTPLILGTALALGGLARAAWPAPETSALRRGVDFILGLVGLGLGLGSAGALVGVLPAVAAIAIGVAGAGGAVGVAVVAALASCVLALGIGLAWRKTVYSALLGGVPHAFGNAGVITQHLKQIAFSLFPWIALTPMAGVRALDIAAGSDEPDPHRARARFGMLVLVSWFALEYVAGTFQSAGVTEQQLPVGPALMLIVGAYLDELLDGRELMPFAGLTVALGAILLGRDFFLFPESYVGAHISEAVRWPGPLTQVPYYLMGYAAFWGCVMGLGLGVRVAAVAAPDEQHRRGRQYIFAVAGGAALLMALATVHAIVPQVSKHLSARDLYGKTRKLNPNAPVGQYRFNAQGASYYAGNQTPTTLSTLNDLFTFLKRSERVFVMAGSDELAPIDQAAREGKSTYYVIDDSNSRYLVLSNQLGAGEKDLNPLRLFISETPPHPQHAVVADFEGKVQLVGYDLPADLNRGQDFKIRLYFKVLAPLPGSYKVFIHFDGPGTRFNGDHVPMEGRFPTQHWVPGYYITDEHAMQPDRATQPAGAYRVFMGFFSGETRLKVTSGPQDGENRVKLDSLTIR